MKHKTTLRQDDTKKNSLFYNFFGKNGIFYNQYSYWRSNSMHGRQKQNVPFILYDGLQHRRLAAAAMPGGPGPSYPNNMRRHI